MAWDDFTECMGDKGEALVDIGEDVVKELANMWKALPPDIKRAVIVAGGWGARYLAAALAAAGIAAAEAIAAIAVSFGVGVFMGALVDCADRHL